MARPVMRQLACGATLIVEEMSGVQSAGLTWLIPAGAARDPDGLQGLSALWSELLLRGAGKLDSRAHADALDRLGVNLSTSNGLHYLRIGATMLGSRLLDALPLVTDMVTAPRMDPESMGAAKDLCIQAIEGLKDDPQERVTILLREKHNDEPLNRSGLGTIEGLTAISHADATEGWRRTALPVGSCFSVAGAVDADAVEARLNDLFKEWEGAAPPLAPGGLKGVRGYHHITEETNQVHIAICFDGPREADGDAMAERVVNAALSGGMSGRLFTEVREKRGLCYSVHASYRADRDFGRIVAYSGTTPERAQQTMDVLWGELERVNGAEAAAARAHAGAEAPSTPDGRLDESEFKRAIVGMKSRIVMSGESTSARAATNADDWHKLGRPRSLEEFVAQVDAMTLDRVNAYLAKRKIGKATVVTIGPEPLRAPAGVA